MKYPQVLGLLFILLMLAACAAPTPIILPTRTPTQTAVLTETIVWFPPTATYTPFPTRATTATPDQRPQFGSLIFADDFTDAAVWPVGQTANGSIALAEGALTLALATPTSFLFASRSEPVLGDFYLEITADVSLCRGEDEFGVLFRYNGPSDYYRFGVSCDGQVRLDRILRGQPSSPQPWLPTGFILPGAPKTVELAVWAVGAEMRFYANGRLLFTASDRTLAQGTVGVYARAAGDTAVTVSFSDLTVYQAP